MGIASKIGDAVKGVGRGIANGTKKVANGVKNVNDAFKKIGEAAKKAWAFIKRKIIFFGAGLLLILVIISLIIDAIHKNKENKIKATTDKYEEQMANGTFEGDADLARKAIELNNTYNSKIGFTDEQINDFYEAVLEACEDMQDGSLYKETYQSRYGWIQESLRNEDTLKDTIDKIKKDDENIKDNPTEYESYVWNYYKYTKDGKFLNMITPYDNIPILKHCYNIEKYNFNAVNWKKYTHTEDGIDLKADEFKYDTVRNLLYPTAGNYKLDRFIDLLSPYLMCSDIPTAYMDSSLLDAKNTTMGHTVVDDYYDNLLGRGNYYSNFAYQIILHGQSDITMNQYVLANQTIYSYYRDYDVFDCTDEFQIKVTHHYTEVTIGYDENDEPITDWVESGPPTYEYVGGYKDGTQTTDDSNKKEHVNTRWEPGTHNEKNSCEEGISRVDGATVEYKLARALAFDVNINNSFDYERYSDEDCEKLENPTALLREERSDYTEVASGRHLTEADIQGTDAQSLLGSCESSVTSSGGDKTQGYTTSVYTCKTHYTYNKGDRFDLTRYYADTVSAEPTSTSKTLLSINDMIAYNKNPKKDPTMDTISDKDFKSDQVGINYYNTVIEQEDKALNTIFFLNSNPKIYLKYMAAGMAYSKYVGYDLADFPLYKGNSLLKEGFERLARENEGNLPFVYGASYGFDVNASPASSINGGSGKTGLSLLKEYIRSFEGAGESPVGPNDEGVECYTAYRDSGGDLTIGYGVNIDAHPNLKRQMEELAGYSIDSGTKVPVEIVDKVEDDFIMTYYNMAKGAANGLDLKEYQLHALASLCYNTGGGGIIDKISSIYVDPNYWNEEVDDRFEEVSEKYKDTPENVSAIQAEANKERGMYKDYFALYVHNKYGEVLDGLVTRRLSEYIVFSLGYYDKLKRFYMVGGNGNLAGIELVNPDGSINEEAVIELQLWYESNVFVNGPTAPLNVNCGMGSHFKGGGNNADGYGIEHINPDYYQFFRSGCQPIRANFFQCTWWAESCAYAFLSTNSNGKFGDVMGKGPLGNGGEVAPTMAQQYGVTLYKNIEDMQQGCHYVISTGGSPGHVMYVEAVGANDIVLSHCGSGVAWYGLAIVSKQNTRITNNNGFVCLEEILENYK